MTKKWRWCQCASAGTRWRDPAAGLVEVTSALGPEGVRVLGLNNSFLLAAILDGEGGPGRGMNAEWRDLHDHAAKEVPSNYLFHESRRSCWAVVIAVGQTGDVFYVPFADAAGSGPALFRPGSSTDRASQS